MDNGRSSLFHTLDCWWLRTKRIVILFLLRPHEARFACDKGHSCAVERGQYPSLDTRERNKTKYHYHYVPLIYSKLDNVGKFSQFSVANIPIEWEVYLVATLHGDSEFRFFFFWRNSSQNYKKERYLLPSTYVPM